MASEGHWRPRAANVMLVQSPVAAFVTPRRECCLRRSRPAALGQQSPPRKMVAVAFPAMASKFCFSSEAAATSGDTLALATALVSASRQPTVASAAPHAFEVDACMMWRSCAGGEEWLMPCARTCDGMKTLTTPRARRIGHNENTPMHLSGVDPKYRSPPQRVDYFAIILPSQ